MKASGITHLYALLAGCQALHSIEEYVTGFYSQYDVISEYVHGFIPAIPVCTISESTFIIFNIILNVFLLSMIVPMRKRLPGLIVFCWGFAIVELTNGLLHLTITIMTGRYFPGTISAIGLLILSILLLGRLKTEYLMGGYHKRFS